MRVETTPPIDDVHPSCLVAALSRSCRRKHLLHADCGSSLFLNHVRQTSTDRRLSSPNSTTALAHAAVYKNCHGALHSHQPSTTPATEANELADVAQQMHEHMCLLMAFICKFVEVVHVGDGVIKHDARTPGVFRVANVCKAALTVSLRYVA